MHIKIIVGSSENNKAKVACYHYLIDKYKQGKQGKQQNSFRNKKNKNVKQSKSD